MSVSGEIATYQIRIIVLVDSATVKEIHYYGNAGPVRDSFVFSFVTFLSQSALILPFSDRS